MNAFYFPHEATSFSSPKLENLFDQEGHKGYSIYWILLEYLAQRRDYQCSMKHLGSLARRTRTTTQYLMRIISQYELFQVEDGKFFSPGLIDRMVPLEEKRAAISKQCSNAAKAKWQKINDSRYAAALQEKENIEEERKEE